MNKFTQLSTGLLAGALLIGCGGGGSSSSTNTGTSSNSAQVSIDAMTTVPVINGSATQGTLYVHNYATSAASGVSFNLGSATTKTKVKAALAKVGLNLGAYEDANGFVLINPERCASIPAGGSCAVNFTTPSMSVGNLGNSLVKLAYNGSKGATTTSQVVNYKYVNLAALSGVNFTGSLNVIGAQGSTQHVVGYLYAGGASGTSYKNVNLSSTNATTTISNGFINGQEVVAGQVIAVEFAVAMQSNKASSVNVTPNWGSTKLQSSLLGAGGSPLTLSLSPAQNTVNFIFGNIPVLSAPTTSASIVNVLNNGNADSSGGLTATATGGAANDLIISNGCSSTVLLANAANSCQITFSTNSYTSGTTTVEYKDNQSNLVGSQTVVWTNTKPFPAIYLAPSPTTISLGKGVSGSESSIVFTVTNVGQAPLESVTYPVTNTGAATWTQDGSTCSSSIGALASCAITGHLTGTNDGTGSLYIKALGSANGVNYSFAALPLTYIVTAAPSLQITPASASMTLLANGVESQTQTYTVTNIGNDPALFTALTLNDSSSVTLKPVINGGTCTNSTTLNETNACTVIVTYGPAATSKAINESGIATLQVDYHGGTPDTSYNSQATLNYKLVGNDSYVIESTTVTNLPGAGTSGSPYAGNANLDPMKLTLTYSNPSLNYPMSNFNLNTNSLPYGLTVDGSSTCKTGSATMSFESGASCTLVLALDRSLLATASGSVVLNFTTPTATWTTPLGFYSQAGTLTYLTYAQPSVVFALSQNGANFESTVLSITGSNLDKGANPLPVSVSGVKNWLESSPVNPSAACTVDPSTYALSCNLTTANPIESVTYIMPNYLQTGESADIPLIFTTSAYAYLSPSYTFINYVKTAAIPMLSFFAGTGTAGAAVVGPATSSKLSVPFGVAVDAVGNVYIADYGNNRIEKVDSNGNLSFFAGTGTAGAAVAGLATSSPLRNPTGVAVDAAGNVYIADYANNRVEKVDSNGNLSFFAGTGTAGEAVAGPATSSPLNHPSGVAVDAAGNVYIADSFNNRIEKVNSSGTLSFFAGTGTAGAAVTDVATSSPLNNPTGVAVDAAGNVYIADQSNNRVEKVDSNGNLSFFAGTGTSGTAMAGVAISSPLNQPFGVAVDAAGNVYIADQSNNWIEKVDSNGNLSFFAGTGAFGSAVAGPATSSPLKNPHGVAVGAAGNIYIADTYNNRIEKVTP